MVDTYTCTVPRATPMCDQNTPTRVRVLLHAARMAGKQEAFSADENRVLREALRKLKDERDLNQAAVGRILGIKQQNAGRLLSAKYPVGMGRGTANNLARELGYRDAEDLLLQRGLDDPTSSNRTIAAAFARRLSYNEAAIDAVLARYPGPEYEARPIKWWVTKFGDEERELAAELAGPAAVKAPERRLPVLRPAKPAKRKRSRTA